jgi:hypothetical protein
MVGPLCHKEIQRKETKVKARILTTITGSFWYCRDGSGYENGVDAGQIVELSKEQARHEIAAGRASLVLDGPLPRAFDKGHTAQQLAQLGK